MKKYTFDYTYSLKKYWNLTKELKELYDKKEEFTGVCYGVMEVTLDDKEIKKNKLYSKKKIKLFLEKDMLKKMKKYKGIYINKIYDGKTKKEIK